MDVTDIIGVNRNTMDLTRRPTTDTRKQSAKESVVWCSPKMKRKGSRPRLRWLHEVLRDVRELGVNRWRSAAMDRLWRERLTGSSGGQKYALVAHPRTSQNSRVSKNCQYTT